MTVKSTRIMPQPSTRERVQLTDTYDDGHLRVEHDNYYVACNNTNITLPRKEFLILSRLTRNANRIVAAEELWRYAWSGGNSSNSDTNSDTVKLNTESLHVHIYRLRRKLEAHGLNIETMVGVGYRLRTATRAS